MKYSLRRLFIQVGHQARKCAKMPGHANQVGLIDNCLHYQDIEHMQFHLSVARIAGKPSSSDAGISPGESDLQIEDCDLEAAMEESKARTATAIGAPQV